MFWRALLALRGPVAKAGRNFRTEINSLDQLSKFLNKRYGIARPKEFFQARLSRLDKLKMNLVVLSEIDF